MEAPASTPWLASRARAIMAIRVIATDSALKHLGSDDNVRLTVEKMTSEFAPIIAEMRGEIIDGDLSRGMVVHFPSNTIVVLAALKLQQTLEDNWKAHFVLNAGIQVADIDNDGHPFVTARTDASDVDVAISLMTAAKNGQVLMTRVVHNNARIGLTKSPDSNGDNSVRFYKVGDCGCKGIDGHFTVFGVARAPDAPELPDFSESLNLIDRDSSVGSDATKILEQFLSFQSFIDSVHYESILGKRELTSEEDLKARVEAMLRLTLGEAAKVISLFTTSQFVCSIKVKKSKGKFACIYPPQGDFLVMKKALEELSSDARYSYAGRCLRDDVSIFVPDFEDVADRDRPKWPKKLRRLIDEYGIEGIVVFPLRVTLADGCHPRGVFKIDFFEKYAFQEDLLFTYVVEMVANQIALAWQREASLFREYST